MARREKNESRNTQDEFTPFNYATQVDTMVRWMSRFATFMRSRRRFPSKFNRPFYISHHLINWSCVTIGRDSGLHTRKFSADRCKCEQRQMLLSFIDYCREIHTWRLTFPSFPYTSTLPFPWFVKIWYFPTICYIAINNCLCWSCISQYRIQ